MAAELTTLDLFSGCGGFSLGMKRAGFRVLAAIDFNPEAICVFQKNFPEIQHVLCRDLTAFPPESVAELIGTQCVDVVVGGPPCQGFSQVRQRDGANNGLRMVHDPRRSLYQEFLKYVAFFDPRVFVMENVPGIKSADGGQYFTRVQAEARSLGYRVHGQMVRAADYGVPQKRVRQLIIGTRSDLPEFFRIGLMPPTHATDPVTLGEAIRDLPPLKAGKGLEETDYDMLRRKRQVAVYGRRYLYDVLEVHKALKLTAHRARPHSERDLRDFARLREGEHCAEAMKRGETFEFPYDKKSFKDRYTRQHRNESCSTIVAHLSKDGLMFIHPTQNRSLTPREAARLQSFPDWFEFPIARTHQFRVIGNAVPPLVAEAVGRAVKSYLEATLKEDQPPHWRLRPIPGNQEEAIESLLPLVHASEAKSLRKVPAANFLRGWCSIGFLYGGLHPDSALEHGTELCNDAEDFPEIRKVDARLLAPYYVQSGWPVLLAPVAEEAWRRYEADELRQDEFYCTEAIVAGMKYRNSKMAGSARRRRVP